VSAVLLQLVAPWQVTLAADVVAWGMVHVLTGYLAHRLPAARLEEDGVLLAQRRFERGGRWYREHLRIDRWKNHLPEAGAFFPGGVSKRQLRPGGDGLRLLVRESRRAELAHWWALVAGAVFVVGNPPLAAVLLIGYGVAFNLPFIAVQRYNRFRALALLARRSLPSRVVPGEPGTGAATGFWRREHP
jgi:glycosyl-4,4'-diaponeurosporenoate acyltransferase